MDDHIIFLDGLRKSFSSLSWIEVLFIAENGKVLIDFLEKSLIPDIVLLDLQMPILNGFETTEILCYRYPTIKIIFLTMFSDIDIVIKSKALGAKGYLTKTCTREDLIFAVQEVYSNRLYFPTLHRKDYLL